MDYLLPPRGGFPLRSTHSLCVVTLLHPRRWFHVQDVCDPARLYICVAMLFSPEAVVFMYKIVYGSCAVFFFFRLSFFFRLFFLMAGF